MSLEDEGSERQCMNHRGQLVGMSADDSRRPGAQLRKCPTEMTRISHRVASWARGEDPPPGQLEVGGTLRRGSLGGQVGGTGHRARSATPLHFLELAAKTPRGKDHRCDLISAKARQQTKVRSSDCASHFQKKMPRIWKQRPLCWLAGRWDRGPRGGLVQA